MLVLGIIILVLSTISVQAAPGCYTYLGSDETLYCQPNVDSAEAQADCDANTGCNMNINFAEGSDCSEFVECQQATCTVDCQTHALGWCRQLGLNVQYQAGEEVVDFNSQCAPGCCRVSKTNFESCNYGVNEYQCNLRSFRAEVPLSQRIFDNSAGMNQVLCQQNICQAQINYARLFGMVTDQDGAPPETTVTLQIQGTDTSITADPAAGSYSFDQLVVGAKTVRVTAPGYREEAFTIQLTSNAVEFRKDITLTKLAGAGVINGLVVDEQGQAVSGAIISWGNNPDQQALSQNDGQFTITLPAGSYTLRAAKDGFRPSSPSNALVTEGQTTAVDDLVLLQQPFQGIAGITKVDLAGFGNFQNTAAVRVFVDGVFRGFSQPPDGRFKIPLPIGEHLITARFEYEALYESEPLTAAITRDSTVSAELLLAAQLGECSEPGTEKNVELFLVSALPGKKEVELKWGRPCAETIGYELVKRQGDRQIGPKLTFQAAKRLFLDQNDLEWGQTYTYEITALYDRGRKSPQPTVSSITLGNKICEGKYNDLTQRWATFCDVTNQKQVLTCDNANNLIVWTDCSERDVPGESDYYCARLSEGAAECKNAGICLSSGAQPFGLYHTSAMCYGVADPEPETITNFCYYDFSPKTITNLCQSCATIKSCFDYLSKGACEINNCAATACRWVDSAAYDSVELVDYSLLGLPAIPAEAVTPETGTGYCAAEDYDSDDKCSLCSSKAGIFENYFCTADVCANLGRCYSNHPSQGEALSFCSNCGSRATEINNCYSYTTELECTGGEAVRNNNGEMFPSADSCGWKRCYWNGGSCIKDGDANIQDDCAAYTGREYAECIVDNFPPETTILGESVISVSNKNQQISFEGKDNESLLGSFHYCLAGANSPGTCEFSESGMPYSGRNRQETVLANLLQSPELKDKKIAGETFLVRYYSKDKYSNQENVKESLAYVDNVNPEFVISEQITTAADLTALEINLEGLREPAKCAFNLKKEIPTGASEQKIVGREVVQKTASFTGLNGISYSLNVTCEDDYGNMEAKKETYVFDLEEDIEIIHPPLNGAVAETAIVFRAATQVGATCELFSGSQNNNYQKIADFVTDSTGKTHQTAALPGFFEQAYAATHKIVCRELLDADEVFEEYFNFVVDFTAPVTEIVLTEGSREVRPIKYGWEEFFIKKVGISFECNSGEGFACDKTYYCLGEECDFAELNSFTEFTEALSLEKSSRICYYSTDLAGNQVVQATCGSAIIDGFGIALEKPLAYSYNDQTWGVSNQPAFPLQFSTRVPTTECRIDFNSGFNYENTPSHKILSPNADGKYVVDNFPAAVFSTYHSSGGVKKLFVKCINADGEIGPEKQFNLEYDPTAPEILTALADPDKIIEGIATKLKVNTDDKTLCKYSDNSDGGGSAEYQTMEFSFPGASERILGLNHEDIFHINFVGRTKDYRLNAQCANGAGDTSDVEEITFNVDYSELGNIVSVFPDGQSFSSKNIELRVETNKEAACQFKQNETYIYFGASSGLMHTSALTNLAEGEYVLDIKCLIEGEARHAPSRFNIDLTPPLITEIADGNYSCGSPYLNIFIYTNESKNLSSYAYELFDLGERTGKVGSISGIKVLQGSTDGKNPLLINTSELFVNHTYIVKAAATDAAGNVGKPKESDGVMIVSRNHSACADDGAAPLIQFVEDNSACSSISVEMRCTDKVGCSTLRYGQEATADKCAPALPYNGKKLEFSKTGWICYYVEDFLGNNHTARREAVFLDSDGDGIKDRCDQCKETLPGKVVGKEGCAEGDVSAGEKDIDTDKDGLPDSWEQQYNSLNCPLDYTAIDSDADGISDNKEDYDQDRRSNLEESVDNTHPCKEDAKTPKAPIDGGSDIINETNLVAWILLAIGLALMGGGMGYLSYYYHSAPARAGPSMQPRPLMKPAVSAGEPVPAWKRDLLRKRLERLQKTKAKSRKNIFSEFAASPLSKIQQAIGINEGRRTEFAASGVRKAAPGPISKKESKKEEARSDSGKQKQSIFGQLESLASKKKTYSGASSATEGEDIFSKLKKIAKRGANK